MKEIDKQVMEHLKAAQDLLDSCDSVSNPGTDAYILLAKSGGTTLGSLKGYPDTMAALLALAMTKNPNFVEVVTLAIRAYSHIRAEELEEISNIKS